MTPVGAELSERLLLLEERHCRRDHALHACPLGGRRGGGAVEALIREAQGNRGDD